MCRATMAHTSRANTRSAASPVNSLNPHWVSRTPGMSVLRVYLGAIDDRLHVIVRIDAHLAEVHRARIVAADLAPRPARVVRAEETGWVVGCCSAARATQAETNGQPNISRISTATGLNRREVTRLVQASADAQAAAVPRGRSVARLARHLGEMSAPRGPVAAGIAADHHEPVARSLDGVVDLHVSAAHKRHGASPLEFRRSVNPPRIRPGRYHAGICGVAGPDSREKRAPRALLEPFKGALNRRRGAATKKQGREGALLAKPNLCT